MTDVGDNLESAHIPSLPGVVGSVAEHCTLLFKMLSRGTRAPPAIVRT